MKNSLHILTLSLFICVNAYAAEAEKKQTVADAEKKADAAKAPEYPEMSGGMSLLLGGSKSNREALIRLLQKNPELAEATVRDEGYFGKERIKRQESMVSMAALDDQNPHALREVILYGKFDINRKYTVEGTDYKPTLLQRVHHQMDSTNGIVKSYESYSTTAPITEFTMRVPGKMRWATDSIYCNRVIISRMLACKAHYEKVHADKDSKQDERMQAQQLLQASLNLEKYKMPSMGQDLVTARWIDTDTQKEETLVFNIRF